MKTLADLKKTLIPFATLRVSGAQVAWLSPESPLSAEAFLQHFAWVIPAEHEEPAVTKRFWADLYGGGEVAGNGGSARAGFDGQYQVKGIGATPLVSRYRDRSHSDGCICTFQALSDAFWGRVLHKLLPYGAVQAQGIITTPLIIPNDAYPANTPRALLVRDAPVRLAHFDRALFYKPQEEIASQLPRDYERTENNYQQLENFLDTELAQAMENCDSTQQAGRCLVATLVARLARQLAFCRASLLKLTTSASNVTLTGALLDFNATSSAVPKLFRNREHWDEQIRYLNNEWQNVLGSLQNLNFLWHKYRGGAALPYTAQQVQQLYATEHQRWRIFYTLCRSGFPAGLHATLPAVDLANFITLYDRALVQSPKTLFSAAGELPAVTRLFIALAHDKSSADKVIRQYASGAGRDFLCNCLHLAQAADHRQLTAMAMSSYRQRCLDERLDFHAFNEEFKAFNGPLTQLMEQAVTRALFHLTLDDGECIALLPGDAPGLTFSWQTGQLMLDNQPMPLAALPAEIRQNLLQRYDERVLTLLSTMDE